MDRSFEIRPVPDAQVRSGPVRSGPRSVRVQGSAEHRVLLYIAKNVTKDDCKEKDESQSLFSMELNGLSQFIVPQNGQICVTKNAKNEFCHFLRN